MTLSALIWDVDGTLAETEDDGHRVAFNQAFREEGLDWQWDTPLYGELLATAGGKERLAAWWQQVDPQAAAQPEAAARIARLHVRKTALYVALVQSGAVQLRPGVKRLLQEARHAGMRLAIATTTHPDNVRALVHATLGAPALAWFEAVGAGDIVPNKKPAPDVYTWVLAHLGLTAADCMAIEDSPAGLAAACAAGLRVVLTRNVFTPAAAQWSTVPGVLADLSDLGEPGHPATGSVNGVAWSGVVDLPTLARWHAATHNASPTQ